MYSSIVWKPAFFLAVDTKVYSHFLSVFRRGSRPVRRRACYLLVPLTRSLPFTSLHHSSNLSYSASYTSTAISLAPVRLMYT